MHPALPLLITSLLGIDVGWADLPGKPGQREYILQIEPAVLARLEDGEAITSLIDASAGTITQIRLQVGNGPLPRKTLVPVSTPTVGVDRPADTGPPLPSEDVLEISGSPEPIQKEYVLPPPVLTATPPELGPPGPVSEDRESEFAIPGGLPLPEAVIPDSIPGEENDSEVSSSEIEKTAELVFDEGTDDPGEFLPILPVTEVAPPVGLAGVAQQRDVAPTISTEGGVAVAAYAIDLTTDTDTGAVANERERPWAPLVMAILALVGSLGANVYLGMLFAGLYRRHKRLKNEQRADGEANS